MSCCRFGYGHADGKILLSGFRIPGAALSLAGGSRVVATEDRHYEVILRSINGPVPSEFYFDVFLFRGALDKKALFPSITEFYVMTAKNFALCFWGQKKFCTI